MIEYILNQNKKFVVKWRPTTWCNYNCYYCCNNSFIQKSPKLTKETIILERASKINNLIDNYIKEKTSLQILGGEVMFYHMNKILEQFTSIYIKNIQITSNFSAPIALYIRLNSKISLLSLSYHDSQVEFDKFFNKLEELAKQVSYKIKVEFVVNNDNSYLVEKIQERISSIESNKIKLVIDNEHGILDGLRYLNCINNNENSAFIVNDSNTLLSFGNKSDVIQNYGGLNLNGYYCSGSMRNIEIRDENIYDVNCKQKKLIGTLDSGFEKHTKKCAVNNCILCGNISVNKNYDNLKSYLKETKQIIIIKKPKKKKKSKFKI